jgi:hypothetical protein
MKIKLRLHKDKSTLHEGIYEVSDAESFGRACADAWAQIREKRLASASSIGALFDALNDQMLDELHGAEIDISEV